MNAEFLCVTQLQNVGAAGAVTSPAWLAVWCEVARRRVLTQRADFINASSVTKAHSSATMYRHQPQP